MANLFIEIDKIKICRMYITFLVKIELENRKYNNKRWINKAKYPSIHPQIAINFPRRIFMSLFLEC